MKFNVITPFGRYENKNIITNHLRDFNIIWHPIVEEKDFFEWAFCEDWIVPYIFRNKEKEGGHIANRMINEFIKYGEIKDGIFYSVLCDDDFYEDKFFDKIYTYLPVDQADEVTVVSMKRGDNAVGIHPTHTLFADSNNMKECCVGIEQLIIRGDLLKKLKLDCNDKWADGKLARGLIENNRKIIYLDDVYVLFNFLEAGRWKDLLKSA